MSRIETLIADYLAAPRLLRDAIAGLSREQLRARPIAGKWSTLEVVCHLADFEPIYADRMKRVIAEDRPTLLGADESRFAAALAYHDRDADEEMALIEVTRSQMAKILRTLPDSALDRVGMHSERGPLTLHKLLETMVSHVQHHVKFIDEKRRALR